MARYGMAAVLTQLRSPLIRSGSALILSSGLTSGLGFVFWVVAARSFTSTEVGLAVAAIAATDLIANLANLGWKSGLMRFAGESGIDVRRLIGAAYVTASVAAFGGGLLFLVGQPLWTPALSSLRSGWVPAAVFVATCVGWVLFQLEDSVLIGTQRASWVPIENAVFSLLRIGLLVPFAAITTLGIYYAWALAVFPLVVIINVLLSRRIPRSGVGHGPAIELSSIVRFAGADWVATSSLLVMTTVIPLIVLAIEGPTAAAYYYLAATMAETVRVVSANVADALVAHAAVDTEAIRENGARVAKIAFAISVPMVIALVVLAPRLLAIFGSEYASEGAALLRLMALATIPNVVLEVYSGVARSEKRQRSLVVVSVVTSVLVVVLASLLLGPWGLSGVGVAWIVGLGLPATYLLFTEFSDWWSGPSLIGVTANEPAEARHGYSQRQRRQRGREPIN